MPELVTGPSLVDEAGGRPEFSDSYMFPARSGEAHVVVSRLRCAGGWAGPEGPSASGLDEYVLVLRGLLRVEHPGGVLDVRAGDGACIRAGERVRLRVPGPDGADYVVVHLLGPPRGAERAGRWPQARSVP